MSEFLNQYVEDAIRTESKLDELNINESVVANLFSMYVHLTEVLDGLKKAVFYGKDEKFRRELSTRLTTIAQICNQVNNPMNLPNSLVTTGKTIKNVDPRVFHGILGEATESGEKVDILLQLLNDPNSTIDKIHVQEELGDSNWYGAILHDALGLDFEQTLVKNINKLKVRFPNKYSDQDAENRNLEAERKELEK